VLTPFSKKILHNEVNDLCSSLHILSMRSFSSAGILMPTYLVIGFIMLPSLSLQLF